jgi:hypothetical protein
MKAALKQPPVRELVPVLAIGLQKFEQVNNLSVNAAEHAEQGS